jgi:GxxExxY protein
MKYEDITRKIIAAAMKVHTSLGNGFPEVIYQRALEIELPYHELSFEREMEMPVYYRDQLIGKRRVDFFVNDLIVVELKAFSGIEDAHIAQTLNYLEAYNMEIGLLINFGAKSLEFHRLTNKKYSSISDPKIPLIQ